MYKNLEMENNGFIYNFIIHIVLTFRTKLIAGIKGCPKTLLILNNSLIFIYFRQV